MTPRGSFVAEQRERQGDWFSEHLSDHCGHAGVPYRVPPTQRLLNLPTQYRDAAERLFEAKPVIQWHQHANHGLSSQMCCVNFLLPFSQQPELLRSWVEHVIGEPIVEMLPVEEDRAGERWFVTFEWIGEHDYLNEAKPGTVRKRGANATAADAAVRFRDLNGRIQLLLIEWKYTEKYGQPLTPGEDGRSNRTRQDRYQGIYLAPNGPIHADRGVALDDFFYEPFYQMVRQQMLAWHTESREPGVDRVRVLHLSPSGNRALHKVTSPTLQRFGDDAFEVFRSLLVNPDDFVSMSIEDAFAPLANWPEADWYPWLKDRYASLCTETGDSA